MSGAERWPEASSRHRYPFEALIGDYRKGADGNYSLQFTFVIHPGEARLPQPPITGKAKA